MASTKLGKQLARAAAAGLLAAACGGANSNAAPSRQAEGASPANEPGASESEPNGMQDELAAEAKDCCKGMNECKGQGGCGMAGSHACKGMNECKGQGGCNAHCPK